MSQFTLVGGTALAIQIKHRLSEDLDFISDEEELDVNLIKRNIGKSAGAVGLTFRVKDHSLAENRINIAKAKIIAVLKFSAIAQRNTMRDYYDLYCLSRYHNSLLELITFTKEINPNLSPITYTETLVYTKDIEEDDISSHLSPRENISKGQIAEYFSRELIKIKEWI